VIVDKRLRLKEFMHEIDPYGGGALWFEFDDDTTTTEVSWVESVDEETPAFAEMREFKVQIELDGNRVATRDRCSATTSGGITTARVSYQIRKRP